jgi:RNA polymerase sigma-70 factor (ECF subfamily)
MSVFPDTPVTMLARMAARVTGESEAGWVRFFELYEPVIKKFAEFAGAKRDSEDVVQDVFVKLVEVFRRGGYNPEKGKFRSYLSTMIRREVINRWQKAKVRGEGRHVSIDNDDSPLEVAVPSETAAILDAKWRLAQHAAAVEHILTKTALAQKSKDIYHEYVIKERPIGEVAKEFGVPNNSVSQIKTRVERMIADYEAMIKD